MRAVIQRASEARVSIGNEVRSQIGPGLLVFLGIEESDTHEDVSWLAGKVARLRIFDDDEGVMNLPVTDAGGDILVVSQFTLHASTRKGNRPSYVRAARPETAIPLYEAFIDEVSRLTAKPVQSGVFGAMMSVMITNEGPVTIIIDTKTKE
jgi:D-tyrosyl-tRNA(Tyr) deacylase